MVLRDFVKGHEEHKEPRRTHEARLKNIKVKDQSYRLPIRSFASGCCLTEDAGKV
jgi:hypothetical protein